MSLSVEDWHDRFLIQAQWTKALRLYFFDLLNIQPTARVLDVGCGTGALLPDLEQLTPGEVFGADISLDHLQTAQVHSPESDLAAADVHQLPFPDQVFEICLSHYLLMWVADPLESLLEMKRVTRKGGYLVCFAEPDYGGRIDHPAEFAFLKKLQISALQAAGADPCLGRKLKALFHQAGLLDIQCGVYEGRWRSPVSIPEQESEWRILLHDLQDQLSPAEIDTLQEKEREAQGAGTRLVHVPTFYAWGLVG